MNETSTTSGSDRSRTLRRPAGARAARSILEKARAGSGRRRRRSSDSRGCPRGARSAPRSGGASPMAIRHCASQGRGPVPATKTVKRRSIRTSKKLRQRAAPPAARDLSDWVTRELPKGEQPENTLGWMLREGDGEALETIAREEHLPAPTVRQHAARLRRHFRTRWAAELAALSVLALFVGAGFGTGTARKTRRTSSRSSLSLWRAGTSRLRVSYVSRHSAIARRRSTRNAWTPWIAPNHSIPRATTPRTSKRRGVQRRRLHRSRRFQRQRRRVFPHPHQ